MAEKKTKSEKKEPKVTPEGVKKSSKTETVKNTETGNEDSKKSKEETKDDKKQTSTKTYLTYTGTLGADVESRDVNGGKLVSALAVYIKDETGNSKRIDAVVWNESIEKHLTSKKVENVDLAKVKEFTDGLKKGDQVKINGYFKEVSYTNKDGEAKKKDEFIVTNFNGHTKKENVQQAVSEQRKITGKVNNDPIIEETEGKKKAVFYINYKPDQNSEWVSQKCQVHGDHVDKCNIHDLKRGDVVTIEGFEGNKYQNKEGNTVSDIFVGETKVIKQSESKEQKNDQSHNSGISM